MTYPPPPGGYGPQQGGYQPMPQYPGQANPQSMRPSGGTAIAAGVLAALGAVFGLVIAVFMIIGMTAATAATAPDDVPSRVVDSLRTVLIVAFVVFLIWAMCLAAGAILLFMRKRLGQILTLIGSGLAIVVCILGAIGLASDVATASFNGARSAGAGVGGMLVIGLPAIATFVLAIIPPTNQYLKWQPGQAGGYGPPQYPMAGGQQW